MLPVLSVLPACGMVILPAGPDAAVTDATPLDGPSPPDAALSDATPDAAPSLDAAPSADASPCTTFEIDFTAMGNQLDTAITIGAVTLQGTFVTLSSGLGLGVDGDGFSPVHVDGTEVLDLVFTAPNGASDIRYTVAEATDANQDGVHGEHLVRAYYHPSGQDAKVLSGEASGDTTLDLDAFFPTLDRAAQITIEPVNEDGIRITELVYSLCEE